MFDLNDQINKWRISLEQKEAYRGTDIDELESHLREEIEHLSEMKLSQEESFLVARHRIGDPGAVADEFAKINPHRIITGRLFWMVSGLLAALMLFICTIGISAICVTIAFACGFKGQVLVVLSATIKVLFLSGVLFFLYKAYKRGTITTRFRCFTCNLKGRIILISSPIISFLILQIIPIPTPSASVMASMYTPQELHIVAITSAWLHFFWRIVLFLTLAILFVRLRPTTTDQVEA